MDEQLKIKLRRFYTEEQIRIRGLLETLKFKASSVDVRVLKNVKMEDFENRDFNVEWMFIDRYCLLKDVLEKIESKNKVPVSPIEFIGTLSKMDEMDEISRICLFQLEKLGWVHLTANGWIQRTICSILSGDGFGPKCLFAVKPKRAS